MNTINTIEVLNGSGHLSLRWDHTDGQQVNETRIEVERLRAAGYSFYLVNGVPADAVTAGAGELIVKRIDDPIQVHEEAASIAREASESTVVGPKRGRQSKATSGTEQPASEPVEGAKAVAIKPQRGG